MDNRRKNIRKKTPQEGDPLEMLRGGYVPWKKSSAEAWLEVESQISGKGNAKVVKLKPGLWQYSAAAVILILFAMTTFMRFYSRTFSTGMAESMVITLPDGSVTSLNAATTVKYYPYWWNISRSISLEGEAFFEVEKGEEFEVISKPGRTLVLGTSFNVFSRGGEYEVTCVTGKVKVVSGNTGDEAILDPSQRAVLNSSGLFSVDKDTDPSVPAAWRRGEFFFTAAPLENVFMEIELQYGITIEYNAEEELIYTGYFKKESNIDSVLNLVCVPFGIKFDKSSEGVYRIIQDE